MPESNKGANARRLKANRAAGIGDADGRLPARHKTEAILLCCAICKSEMKVTKTNTELQRNAEGKHNKTLEECFVGAEGHARDIIARLEAGTKKGGKDKDKAGGGMSKAERKKKDAAMAGDLLMAGLSVSGKKKATKKK